MTRPLRLFGGVIALVLLLTAGLYSYRSLMLLDGRTPEGYQLLTPMADAQSFEPRALPAEPVLENQSPTDLAVNFGYKVAGIPYSYSLELMFPSKGAGKPDAASLDIGKAKITVRHATRGATVDGAVTRRWDAPRHAYAVAVEDGFQLEPAVPALCVKAVIGPSQTGYDLKDASLCIAQRDVKGACHAETLACGLIR